MKGMFVKDMEIMRGNMKTFIGVYIIAIFCFLSTSAGPSFLISYVSVLAAVMALNTIATDDMDNGMPYIFTFPISRKAVSYTHLDVYKRQVYITLQSRRFTTKTLAVPSLLS